MNAQVARLPAVGVGRDRPALSIVVPAFDEAARIVRLLARTRELGHALGRSFELLVVDDGSRDGTAALVERYRAAHPEVPLTLLRLPEHRGKGAALRAGVLASRGDRVLVTDADLTIPVEELLRLERALGGRCAVAAGSRAVPGSAARRVPSSLRRMLGRLGNLWIRTLALPGLRDTQCGFKLFEGDVARALFALSREDRFGIDVEILYLARERLGVEVAEVPIAWEHQDGSKVRWRDYLDVLVTVPRVVWSTPRGAREELP